MLSAQFGQYRTGRDDGHADIMRRHFLTKAVGQGADWMAPVWPTCPKKGAAPYRSGAASSCSGGLAPTVAGLPLYSSRRQNTPAFALLIEALRHRKQCAGPNSFSKTTHFSKIGQNSDFGKIVATVP
jgi:hypothetical protein